MKQLQIGSLKFELKKILLPILYFTICLLATLNILTLFYKIIFLVYAFAIYFFVFQVVLKGKFSFEKYKRTENSKKKFYIALIILAIIIFSVIHVLPFIHHGDAALGYDTGFYLKYFDKDVFPSKDAFTVSASPFYYLGLSSQTAFYFTLALGQFLILASVYFLIRSTSIFSSFKIACVAIFLLSVSAIQFYSFWWAIGQQIMATGFLIITIALLLKRSWLMLLTAALTMFLHTSTFLVLALTFILYFTIYLTWSLIKKQKVDKKLILFIVLGLIVCAFVFYFQYDKISGQFEFLIQYKGLLKNVPDWNMAKATGFFIDLNSFRSITIYLMPWVIIGIYISLLWQRENRKKSLMDNHFYLIFSTLCLFLTITVLPIIYQSRNIVYLNIFMIIFASIAMFVVVEYLIKEKTGKILLLILLLIFAGRIAYASWTKQPLITENELNEIKSIENIANENAVIMATNSSYAPWLFGFSNQQYIISPGYLRDTWGLEKWIQFWYGSSDETRYDMLLKRAKNLYIFMGAMENTYAPYYQYISTDDHFIQISDHVWKFQP